MRKSDINILIVDDENVIGEPLTKAIGRAGYNARHVRDAQLALHEMEVRDYHLLIIDCMLPKTNGIDLSKQLREKSNPDIKIILMSGIFRDEKFVREAIEKTKALAFLTKPFDLNDVLQIINESFSDIVGPETPPFYSFLSQSFVKDSSDQDFVELLNVQENVHGFELPYVYSLLIANKATGCLSIDTTNKRAEIYFDQGRIYRVNSDDTESYFGVLLIENGFSTPEEVARGLALDSDKPIGKRLWEINTLSPHAINIVHQEQLSIRLSKLIQQDTYNIKFTESVNNDEKQYISEPSFNRYLNDWISSKIKKDWLTSFFTQWMENPLLKGPHFALLDSLKRIALVSLAPNLAEAINNKKTLSDLINSEEGKPFLLQSIYFLVLTEILKFDSERRAVFNFDASVKRLRNLKESFDGKNYYQILGVERSSSKEKVQQAFHNFALSAHPDKLPKEAPEELVVLTKEVFQVLSEAHRTLTNSETRQKYNFELDHGRADLIIKSENLFERGSLLLQNKKYNEACELFDEVYQLNVYNDDFFIYYVWALIQRGAPSSQVKKLIDLTEEFISRIPQESRHNSNYFYIKGLFHKLNKDYKKAIVAFKHAFTLNPDFKPAQLEWLSLEKKIGNKDNDGFLGMFKKKSS